MVADDVSWRVWCYAFGTGGQPPLGHSGDEASGTGLDEDEAALRGEASDSGLGGVPEDPLPLPADAGVGAFGLGLGMGSEAGAWDEGKSGGGVVDMSHAGFGVGGTGVCEAQPSGEGEAATGQEAKEGLQGPGVEREGAAVPPDLRQVQRRQCVVTCLVAVWTLVRRWG